MNSLKLQPFQSAVISAVMAVFCFSGLSAQQQTRLTHPIYVQSYGIPGTPEVRVQTVADAGYDGIMWENSSGDLPALISALDARGLELGGRWMAANGDIAGDLALIEGTGSRLVLWAGGGAYPDDETLAAAVAAAADLVKDDGRLVTLYPHFGGYMIETIEDAVRIAQLADRENVGLSFNICHVLMYHKQNGLSFADRFDSLLQIAWPYLHAVSIAGADSAGTDWGTLIQPLDQGNFDNFNLIKTVIEKGFAGVFFLQAYGIGGDVPAHLARSRDVWESWKDSLPAIAGCMDTTYEEYNPDANVSVEDSCRTLGTFGSAGSKDIDWTGISIQAKGKHTVTIMNMHGRIISRLTGDSRKTYRLNEILKKGVYYVNVRVGNQTRKGTVLVMNPLRH